MKTIPSALATHLAQTTTTLARIISLTRTDGTEYFATDHDQDIVYDGDTYLAATGFDMSAIETSASFAPDNAELLGILSSDGITTADIRAGLFDSAAVSISIINWASPSDGIAEIKNGTIGEITTTSSGTFIAEFRSKLQKLDQRVVSVYSPTCRADLGDPSTCKVPIYPDEIERSTAVALGDYYRVPTRTASPRVWENLLANPSFEVGSIGVKTGAGDGTALAGWVIASGIQFALRDTYAGLAADEHDQYLMGGSAGSGECYQDVDLLNAGMLAADIDAGNARINTFSIRRGNNGASDTGRVMVRFLDEDLAIISTGYDSSYEAFSPGSWNTRSVSTVTLPATTRYIRIQLLIQVASGPEINACFDTCVLEVQTTGSPNYTGQALNENRVYEVTTAGTTAGSQPSYDTTIGNPTTDGTAVLTCRDAWMRVAEIETVIDRANFIIRVNEDRAVDDWFDRGVLVFETGLTNVGRAFEIKEWDLHWAGSPEIGQVTLYREVPETVYPGQQVRIYRGCDKSLTECNPVFDNIENYRGEPHLPGLDQIRKIAGSQF